jgi:hypothetical protein
VVFRLGAGGKRTPLSDRLQKPGGKPPKPPVAGPKAQDQLNLTDEESRIMPVSGGGFDQAYNAQAAVDTGSMLVVALGVTQACNDKEQVVPLLEQLGALPASLGQPKALVTDTGFIVPGMSRPARRAALTYLLRQSWTNTIRRRKHALPSPGPCRLMQRPPKPWRTN